MSLNHNDLKDTVLPDISVDEYEPKAGNTKEVIVVAFYVNDQAPAEDLNTFIQRGFIDTIDVEVSPSTDANGRYLVFVEMNRDDSFPNKFQALLKDVENTTGKLDWNVKTYLSADREFKFNDPDLFNFIITNPDAYVSKDEFKMKEMKESIIHFFEESMLTDLTIDGTTVIIAGNGRKIVAEVVDIGDYDDVIGRNFLSESAFGLDKRSYEGAVLTGMLGNCQVLPLGKYLCVSRGETVLLLDNTQFEYGK